MTEQGFKLISIRALDDCDPSFLKILQPNEYYYFYKNYKIVSAGGQEELQIDEDLPADIYNIDDLKVNISAIVGKNGSGKSTLVELLYVCLYDLAHRLKLIDKKDDDGELYRYEEGVNAEICYLLNGKFFKVSLIKKYIYLVEFNTDLKGFKYSENFGSRVQLEHFFYTIVINYSLYGLNSRDMGHWIQSIFHKNDAYQTPIVLNPYRKEGEININSENYLVKSRLLANILDGVTDIFHFKDNVKVPHKLTFKLDESKFQINKRKQKIVTPYSNDLSHHIFPELFQAFFGTTQVQISNATLNKYAKEYIIRKLKNITNKYKQYNQFNNFLSVRKKNVVKAYFTALADDDSHITFKLRQALNFLRFDFLPKEGNDFVFEAKDLATAMDNVRTGTFAAIPTIELLPPSFLTANIEFKDANLFSNLSSGEKQKIYALSSLVYHLRNLDSVKEIVYFNQTKEIKLTRYKNVNIIFDEIELYYHPDLQRRFIKDLLDNIRAAKLKSVKFINFIFITHSPFILSDIPDRNTMYLKLENGKAVQQEAVTNTFGGNIHDLLANSFFLGTEGYMGEFAKNKIRSVIDYLQLYPSQGENNPEWGQDKVRSFIDMIAEPLIKSSLNELYSLAFLTDPDDIDKEIARLQQFKVLQNKHGK
jgi:AAA15 family ATPase/GTPase